MRKLYTWCQGPHGESCTSIVQWHYCWGHKNKCVLTPDRELMTDQSKTIAEVKHGEPSKFIVITYKKWIGGHLKE